MKKDEYYPVNLKPWEYYSKIELDGWGYSIEELLRSGAPSETLIELQYDKHKIEQIENNIKEISFGTTRDKVKEETKDSFGTSRPEPVGRPLIYNDEGAPDNSDDEFHIDEFESTPELTNESTSEFETDQSDSQSPTDSELDLADSQSPTDSELTQSISQAPSDSDLISPI